MTESGDNLKVVREHLLSMLERWERLDAEKKALTDDQREVMAEAKALGYDTKIMRELIKLRKMDPDDRADQEAALEMYRAALGM